jgi:elongation factor P hydroxylase
LTGLPPLDVPLAQPFVAVRLENVFDACFASRWNTCLVGGAEEPFYRPASAAGDPHLLHYRHDYFASALHEVAHWCIAGVQRRQQFDFGYWYAPEGRDTEKQNAFQAVESKPQALEWLFSRACGYRFQVSLDNLQMTAGGVPDATAFRRCVLEQALHWQEAGLPERAGIYYSALCLEFGTAVPAGQLRLTLAQLS